MIGSRLKGRLRDQCNGAGPAAARLIAQERGTTVVELAMAAPLLLLFLMGIVDLSGCVSSRIALQKAADRTLQLVSVKELSRDYAYARTTAATYADVPVQNVTYDAWLECDATRMPSINDICEDGEEVKRLLRVEIRSGYALSFPFSQFAPADGVIDVVASSTLRMQ